MSSTVRTRLMYDNSTTGIWPARMLVFGELVKLAIPAIEHYHSDLFHDALWLEQHLSGEPMGSGWSSGRGMSFYWSVDESGTTIGIERVGMRRNAYRITVTNVGGSISMEAEPLS